MLDQHLRRRSRGAADPRTEAQALVRAGREPSLRATLKAMWAEVRGTHSRLRRDLDLRRLEPVLTHLATATRGQPYVWRVDDALFTWALVDDLGRFYLRHPDDHPDDIPPSFQAVGFGFRLGDEVTLGLGVGQRPHPSPGKAWSELAPWRGVSGRPETVARKCLAWRDAGGNDRSTCDVHQVRLLLSFWEALEGASGPSDPRLQAEVERLVRRKKVDAATLELLLLSHAEGKTLDALSEQELVHVRGVLRAL